MHLMKRALAVTLAAVFAAGTFTGCGSNIDGTKTAVTVGDETATLGMVSFLAHYSSATIYTYYGAYLMSGYFDNTADESTGETYGDQTVLSAAEEIGDMLLLKEHAADYGVEITDEEEKQIEEAAAAYIEKNDSKTLKKVGASKEDVIALLELQTIKSKMLDPMAEDVDTEVTDEEAKQSKGTLIKVSIEGSDASYTTGTDYLGESGDSSVAEDESVSATESLVTGILDEAISSANEASKEEVSTNLEEILKQIQESDDPATCDMNTIAQGVNENYNATSVQWSANDDEQTTVDQVIADAAKSMTDGEVYPEVLTNEDESAYYIFRLDSAFDEEATESKKGSILYNRKQDNYDSIIDGWKETTEVNIDKSLISKIKITDTAPFAFAEESSVTDSDTVTSEASLAESSAG